MKTIFEKTKKYKKENISIQNKFERKKELNLPNLPEIEVMRHYKELSDKNFCIEKGFYPLGSCTMKYNPRINEKVSSFDGFNLVHPNQKDEDIQGVLKLIYDLEKNLKIITGMDAITMQPCAGAHGELTGMMVVKKYFEKIGQNRKKVIIPDSAHGTNPASASMCGFEIIEVKSSEFGQVNIEELKNLLNEDVAAIMMTNPNTLGIFEENILKISSLAHKNGSLLYYDGANFNAIMGYTNPKLMGFDIVHLNLHKTFSTPHGGGGPGAGPVGVVEKLAEFLPVPRIIFDGKKYKREYNFENSIGKVSAYFGNFGVLIRAYTYILMMGKLLKKASSDAVLSANYLKEQLKDKYNLPHSGFCMHEFVLSGDKQVERGVHTIDIAKALMDKEIHPPTVYFPLIVHEAIMIEPTESETKETLDNFVCAMKEIAEMVKNNVDFSEFPKNAPVKRINEVYGARNLDLKQNEI